MRIRTERSGFVAHPPKIRHRKYARKMSIAATDNARKVLDVRLRGDLDPAYNSEWNVRRREQLENFK